MSRRRSGAAGGGDDGVSDATVSTEEGGTSTGARPRDTLVAAAAYLALGVGLWWGVWSSRPSSTTTCGCGDAARFLWFFAWPPFAIAHGQSLFWSAWLFHPTGVNLLADTSVLALSVVLTPVTAVGGPVLALNIGLTLAPVLSALAMWALLRRWTRWAPAAFLGGLVYGFSPFAVTELALSQLNIAFLVVPPLAVLIADDILTSQRRPPLVAGAMLGALLVAQFFLSTEVLLILVLALGVGTGVLVLGTAMVAPSAVRAHAGHAAQAAVVALGTAGAVLAYPLWFLLDGPAHLSGPVWSNGGTARFGTTVANLWSTAGLGSLQAGMTRFGGYQGPALAGLGYLGIGVVVVAVAGAVVFRRDRRLLLCAAVGVIFFILSLAPGHGAWVPWQAIDHVPLVGDIVEGRFALVVTLSAAAVVGMTVDHVHRLATAARGPSRAPGLKALAPWVLGAVVLVPTLVVLAPNLPLTVRPVVVPEWFDTVGRSLPPGRVVLAYPVPFSGLQSSQAWQADNRMRWSQAGGGGPTGQASRAGTARAGFTVLAAASLPLGPAPQPTPADLAAVRRALATWGVTTVVAPDEARLPLYERGRPEGWAIAFLTVVLGEAPVYDRHAWVWDEVRLAPPPVPVAPSLFAHCAALAPRGASNCILGAAGDRTGG